MSIHTWKSMAVAQQRGGLAGDVDSGLWDLSKRELLEIALRLTERGKLGDATGAQQDLLAERSILQQNGVL